MLQLIPKTLYEFLGLIFVVCVGLVGTTILQEWAKRLIRGKFSPAEPDRRRQGDELMAQYMEVHRELAETIRGFSDSVGHMSKSMEKRSNQALEQHETIIEEIARLDVPRKLHRLG